MQNRRAGILLVAAFTLMSCAYQAPPTAPTVMAPVVIVDNPPPALPPPTPITLSLTTSRTENFVGEGMSLRAIEIGGNLIGPSVYAWTFGDGTSETNSTNFAGHAYNQAGSYEASVTVRDRDGRGADARATVVVNRRPSPPREPRLPTPPAPPAELSVSLTCSAKVALTPTPCNVTVSYDGATLRASRVTNVDWDWGDGEIATTPGPSDSHTYARAGTYTVFARVTADTTKGSKKAERSVTINVL